MESMGDGKSGRVESDDLFAGTVWSNATLNLCRDLRAALYFFGSVSFETELLVLAARALEADEVLFGQSEAL